MAALVSGCAGARVDGPERILERAWSGASDGAARTASRPGPPEAERPALEARAPSEPWTLDAILERIARANPTIAAARASLEEARAVRGETFASYFPELSLGFGVLSTDEPAQAFGLLLDQEKLTLGPGFDPTPGSTENWRKEVRLDWPLFAPGRGQARRASLEGEQASLFAREAVERRLLNAGVQAWLVLRAARALEGVARESIAIVERRLEETRLREEAGAALRADVLRLEVRLAAARQEAASASLSVRRAESALAHLMGGAPGGPLALVEEEVAIASSLPEDLDALLAAAEDGRLDLRAAVHGVRRSGFEREASKAERLPVLQAFAAYDVDGPEPAIQTQFDSYSVGLGLRLPFSAGTSARIRRAEAQERRAQEELRELALSIVQEVRDGREGLLVARETLALAEAAVGAAKEAFRIVAEAQDSGGATVTDVLEAEDARRQARVRVETARAGVQIARARLVAATGGVR